MPYGSVGERTQIFTAVFGASNDMFAWASARQTMAVRLEALARAHTFIATPSTPTVPDNARTRPAEPARYAPRALAMVLEFAVSIRSVGTIGPELAGMSIPGVRIPASGRHPRAILPVVPIVVRARGPRPADCQSYARAVPHRD